MPGLEAGLADQRGLLVAGDAADRDGARQEAGAVSPKSPLLSRTSGRSARGTSSRRSSSSSQSPRWMSNSSVREAFVTSVA